MAMDSPRFQKILAKWWPICQRPKRPTFRTLCAAKDPIFLTAISELLPERVENGEIQQSLSPISAPKGGTLRWRRMVLVAMKLWRNHSQSVSGPYDPLPGP